MVFNLLFPFSALPSLGLAVESCSAVSARLWLLACTAVPR